MNYLEKKKSSLFSHRKGRLPQEYQEVEFIGSTTNGILGTNYYANTNTKLVINNYRPKQDTYDAANIAFGYKFGLIVDTVIEGLFSFGASFNTTKSVKTSHVYNPQTFAKLELSKEGFYFNNTILLAFPETSFNDTTQLYLLGYRQASVNYGSSGVMGVVEIYENENLIRQFIPCYRKSDNAIGFYDTCGSIYSATGTSFYYTDKYNIKGDDIN